MFNAPLLRDLDALAEMQKLLHRTTMLPHDLRRLRDLALHKVTIAPAFFAAANGSALDPKPDMLGKLFDAGRSAADEGAGLWLPSEDLARVAAVRH